MINTTKLTYDRLLGVEQRLALGVDALEFGPVGVGLDLLDLLLGQVLPVGMVLHAGGHTRAPERDLGRNTVVKRSVVAVELGAERGVVILRAPSKGSDRRFGKVTSECCIEKASNAGIYDETT